MKNLISIDPGSTSGIVVMTVERNPKLVHSEAWRGKKTQVMPTAIVENLTKMYGLDYAAIEDQYLGKNPNSMKVLTRTGGRWQEACEMQCLPVMWVPPRAWQTKVLGSRWGAQRKQIDRMMKLVARQDTGVKLSADECAAWCLGKYAVWEILK
jgi:Holliday junction resolvasome RuvABC endonuclease subunit